MNPLRVAACHLCPAFLSARETTEKCIRAIRIAAQNSANLVVFPETFIPAFPIWSALCAPTDNHDFFKRMAVESVLVDGEEIGAIRNLAARHGIVVSLGISEKVPYSSGTLFNSNLIINTNGRILIHHRKLVPTFFEKLTWSPGDGYGLRVADTSLGRIGALICGENTNPLARYSLMAQGEQVHISTYPASRPTRTPSPPTNDSTKLSHQNASSTNLPPTAARNYDNVAANRIRAAAHCFEAKCFGVVCSGFLNRNAIEDIARMSAAPDFVRKALEHSPRAATMFVDPTGAQKDGYVVDEDTGKKSITQFLQDNEDILYTDMELEDTIEGKQYHDVVGGYQRLDVFDLKVNRSRLTPATFIEDKNDSE